MEREDDELYEIWCFFCFAFFFCFVFLFFASI